MSARNILSNPALKDHNMTKMNEEWNNFVKRVGEVSGLVKHMASGDKEKADAAQVLADQYLNGKIIVDDNVQMKIKQDRTLINQKAFDNLNKKDTGDVDKEAWMAEVSKDAERRAQDRKIRRERADTLNTQAIKAFRKEEYDKAISCYNRAIEYVKDNSMLYCDRALTNIKLKKYEKVFSDCDLAIRLNEKSYKARLYRAKAYKELEDDDKYEECRKEIDELFPEHQDLTKYFLDKKEEDSEANEE